LPLRVSEDHRTRKIPRIWEQRRTKQLEVEAEKEAESAEYADQPEWRRAMLLKKDEEQEQAHASDK
jgi:hypothetical protein